MSISGSKETQGGGGGGQGPPNDSAVRRYRRVGLSTLSSYDSTVAIVQATVNVNFAVSVVVSNILLLGFISCLCRSLRTNGESSHSW